MEKLLRTKTGSVEKIQNELLSCLQWIKCSWRLFVLCNFVKSCIRSSRSPWDLRNDFGDENSFGMLALEKLIDNDNDSNYKQFQSRHCRQLFLKARQWNEVAKLMTRKLNLHFQLSSTPPNDSQLVPNSYFVSQFMHRFRAQQIKRERVYHEKRESVKKFFIKSIYTKSKFSA